MSDGLDFDKPLIHIQQNDTGGYGLFLGVLCAMILVIVVILFGLPASRRHEVVLGFQGIPVKAQTQENIDK